MKPCKESSSAVFKKEQWGGGGGVRIRDYNLHFQKDFISILMRVLGHQCYLRLPLATQNTVALIGLLADHLPFVSPHKFVSITMSCYFPYSS